MKKITSFILTFITILVFTSVSFSPIKVKASSATTYTHTFDNTGFLVRTQDAYLPGLVLTGLGLRSPNDLFVDDNNILYISDTGNKRVVRYDISNNVQLKDITFSEFGQPMGMFITDDGFLYVADRGAKAIFLFDISDENGDYTFIRKYTRPTEITYGNQDFVPLKVGVDKSKNMFVLSEANLQGVIYLGNGGEFLEYYTANRIELTFIQIMQDLFFTEAQIEQLFPRIPHIFSNLFVGDEGHVYTVTTGETWYPVKKHNTSGMNMFGITFASEDLTDVWADEDGLIYASGKLGDIFVYTSEGEFIYRFGANNLNDDVSGVFDTLVSISVDKNGNIWCLDQSRAIIHSYTQTDFAKNTYKALSLFNQGRYEESKLIWEEILRFNQMSVMAHNGIGRCHLYLMEYEDAMEHFEVAGNRGLYSEAFWEVRNQWLQKNLSTFFVIVVAIIVISIASKYLDRKWQIKSRIRNFFAKVRNVKLIDDLLFAFSFFRKPIDSFYELKVNRRGSTLAAAIIYAVFFIVFMISIVGKDFIYQFQAVEMIDFNSIVIGFFSITLLFIICNYLVSSIKDGDGSMKDIFKLTMYSLTPYMLGLISVVLLSYVLTYNESFMLQYIETGSMIWSLILILLGVQEIHTYDTRDAVKSILITFIFMVLVAVILLIVIILCEQLYQFVELIIKEAIDNVMG